MRGIPPVFALQLSDELPLLLVHIKVDAPVGDHLSGTEKTQCSASLRHRYAVSSVRDDSLTPELSVSASREVYRAISLCSSSCLP